MFERDIRPPRRERQSPLEIPVSEEDSFSESALFRLPRPKNFESIQFHRGPRGGVGHRLMAWSAVAALIDGLILMSTTCFLVIAVGLIARYQLDVFVYTFQQTHWKYIVAGEALLCFFYLTILRSFLGFTLGEWACGLRLGALKQRLNRYYSLRVIARTLVIFAAGMISLPVISLFIGRDVAGWLVGLPLIEHRDRK